MMDDRAVSSALSYALIIVLTVSLTTALVLGTSSLVGDQRERVARDQVDAIGQQLTSAIVTADRLDPDRVRPDELSVTRDFPRRVGGIQYRIVTAKINPDRWRVTVETRETDIEQSFTVRLSSGLELQETTVNGGPLRVYYYRHPSDPDKDELRIEHAT